MVHTTALDYGNKVNDQRQVGLPRNHSELHSDHV